MALGHLLHAAQLAHPQQRGVHGVAAAEHVSGVVHALGVDQRVHDGASVAANVDEERLGEHLEQLIDGEVCHRLLDHDDARRPAAPLRVCADERLGQSANALARTRARERVELRLGQAEVRDLRIVAHEAHELVGRQRADRRVTGHRRGHDEIQLRSDEHVARDGVEPAREERGPRAPEIDEKRELERLTHGRPLLASIDERISHSIRPICAGSRRFSPASRARARARAVAERPDSRVDERLCDRRHELRRIAVETNVFPARELAQVRQISRDDGQPCSKILPELERHARDSVRIL